MVLDCRTITYVTAAIMMAPTMAPTAIPAFAPPESEPCGTEAGTVAEAWGEEELCVVLAVVVLVEVVCDDTSCEELNWVTGKAVVNAEPLEPSIVVTYSNSPR